MADVSVSGPLYDGRAEAALREGVTATRRKVADRGAALTRAAFGSMIRRNTGRFLGSITVTDHSASYSSSSGHHSYTLSVAVPAETDVVTTDLATYGPWLEGAGSRNNTTRFKGYHGFRIAGQELDGQAGPVADEAMVPYVERMN